MAEIAVVLSGAAARHQKRHGGELPLSESEERREWARLDASSSRAEREGIERRTPADELADKESRLTPLPLFEDFPVRRTPFEELDEQDSRMRAESEEAVRIWMEANAWLLDFLFFEGPHPAKVMRRLYAWVKKFRPEAIWDMGYRNLAILFDESHGAMEWRIGALLDDYGRAKGVNGVKAPWQRTAEACASYSTAQKGNSNRLGGKRAGKHKSRKGKPNKK